MTITIFFTLASIGLITFVSIYLKNKKKEYSLDLQEKMNIKKDKKNIKTIWGIDRIQDGILTVNNRHSIIVELGSIEYRLLNDEEQNNIDNNLIRLAKTFKNQTQFFSTIEKIDTSDKISTIKNNIDKQKNTNMKLYGENIIEYLENIMQEENLYVRKNYFIMTSTEPLEKAESELKEYYSELKYNLSNIRVTAKMLSDIDIIELLYRELNKNSSEKIRDIIEEGGLEFYVQARN